MKNPFKSLKKKFFRKNKILPISVSRALNQDICEIVFEYLGKEEHEALTEKIIKFIKDKRDLYRVSERFCIIVGGIGVFFLLLISGGNPVGVIASVSIFTLYSASFCSNNMLKKRFNTWYNKVRGNGKISGKNFLKLLPLQK